jgi:membrane-associated phospholipid phosphatase
MQSLHRFMLCSCSLFLVTCFVGFLIHPNSHWLTTAAAAVALLTVSTLPAIVWNDTGQFGKRDAALTLPWIIALIVLIPPVVGVLAELHLPLRDTLFVKIDSALGFSVPAIDNWVSQHPVLNVLLNRSYDSLMWLIAVAVLLPSLTGRKKAAERFLLANTIAFLTALPVFALLPAIGPWAGYHFRGNPQQMACEASILALRNGTSGGVGIVCFPSFHVIWAVLSATALWSVKPLRIPATLLATLIVISTVTTGWHYATDVLAGFLFAGGSLVCADALLMQRLICF